MLQLVIADGDRYRTILACGVMDIVYTQYSENMIRIIDEKEWEDWNKHTAEWDELEQKLMPKRQITIDAEAEIKRIADINADIAIQMPDMLRRQLSWEEIKAEAKAIDDASLASR